MNIQTPPEDFFPQNESSQLSSNSGQTSKPSKNKTTFLAWIGVGVFALILFFLYMNWSVIETLISFNQNKSSGGVSTSTDQTVPTSSVRTTKELKQYIKNKQQFSVHWHKGAIPVPQQEAVQLLTRIYPNYRDKLPRGYEVDVQSGQEQPICDGCEIFIFEAGNIATPNSLSGTKLYYLFLPELGMGVHYQEALVAYFPEENKFLHFKDVPDPNISFRYDFSKWNLFAETIEYQFPELTQVPETLSVTNRNVFLKMESSFYTQESGNSMESLISRVSGNIGGVYNIAEQKVITGADLGRVVANHDQYGPVYFDGHRYAIQRADGSTFLYRVEPPFFVNEGDREKEVYTFSRAVQINWDSEVKTVLSSSTQFKYGGDIGTNGCGIDIIPLTSIVEDNDWFSENKLVPIGSTQEGEKVFELADKETNEYYRKVYNFGFAGFVYNANIEDEQERERINNLPEDLRYQIYLNSYPIFFWQDGAGDWHVFVRSDYGSLAECGKPVIYLYPEEQTIVNVQVSPNGGFTKTDPEYILDQGWDVIAKPDGALVLPNSTKQYPYLFWEGHATGFSYPKEGFVFARDEVSKNMRIVLKQVGLTEKEMEDFMEYWEPKMKEKSFVRIHLAAQKDFEVAAPLTITPQPNTVFRLFASIQPIDEFVDVPLMQLRPFERKGFTVVEWGGVLLN